MIGILNSDSFLPGRNVESARASSSLAGLCEISPHEFRSKKMRLRRSVLSTDGELLQASLEIELIPGHSVQAGDLAGILKKSCGNPFKYALSTSHPKTFVGGLKDCEDRQVGDIVATFRPARAFRDDAAFP